MMKPPSKKASYTTTILYSHTKNSYGGQIGIHGIQIKSDNESTERAKLLKPWHMA